MPPGSLHPIPTTAIGSFRRALRAWIVSAACAMATASRSLEAYLRGGSRLEDDTFISPTPKFVPAIPMPTAARLPPLAHSGLSRRLQIRIATISAVNGIPDLILRLAKSQCGWPVRLPLGGQKSQWGPNPAQWFIACDRTART